MAEGLKGKTKYYIYDKNKNKLIRETYIEKEAKRYEESGYIVKHRTKRIKND